ncbi:tetratricopeptide repeat protein [Candidatus Poribacteria bacterium]|nr:tetratricopeptide repeat protein [Candidatus Poribacteria bacterium]MYG07337.1 tetratricopeptide repeat protein [Candidatus Poribacteria bacterium]MYK24514.1 tetratricopeptide repeat protein [Candidatus Poribacteria bacterium]
MALLGHKPHAINRASRNNMLSFEQLIQNLKDTTQPSIVRSSAIVGLVMQDSSRSVKFLTDALADADARIRREAAKALQDLDVTSATEPLLRALQIESNDLTLWAMLEALSELGTLSVLPTLESLLNVDSMLTRIEVKKSISRLQDRYPDAAAVTSPEVSKPEPSQERIEIKEPPPTVNFRDPEPAPVNPTEPTVAELDEITDTADRAQPVDKSAEIIDETGPTAAAETPASLSNNLDAETLTDSENVGEATDDTQFVDESVETTDETEDTDSVASDPEPSQREDNTDIKDLSDTIAGSPRLAGSSVNLPVLAPNAATVPYDPKGTALEPTPANFFLTLLHPNRYFSKQWMSRTRAYLILWAVLIAGVIGFTQHQKHFRAASNSLSRIGLSIDELPELAKRSLAEGDFHIQEGYYRKAISAYELSIELGALPINFYRKLGFAYFKEGQYALAVEAFELFLEVRDDEAPDVFAAEASLMGVYPLTSVGEGATRDYETYNILGTAYAKLGRVLDAQRAYEQAIRLAPKYGEAYNNLARLHANNDQHPLTAGLGNPEISPKLRLAEALAYTAVTLNPDVAAYHDTLGWILSKRGQVNKAMKTLERAINLQKDAIEPHYHLAQVALAANKREKAARAIRNVFKLKPSFVPLNTVK